MRSSAVFLPARSTRCRPSSVSRPASAATSNSAAGRVISVGLVNTHQSWIGPDCSIPWPRLTSSATLTAWPAASRTWMIPGSDWPVWESTSSIVSLQASSLRQLRAASNDVADRITMATVWKVILNPGRCLSGRTSTFPACRPRARRPTVCRAATRGGPAGDFALPLPS